MPLINPTTFQIEGILDELCIKIIENSSEDGFIFMLSKGPLQWVDIIKVLVARNARATLAINIQQNIDRMKLEVRANLEAYLEEREVVFLGNGVKETRESAPTWGNLRPYHVPVRNDLPPPPAQSSWGPKLHRSNPILDTTFGVYNGVSRDLGLYWRISILIGDYLYECVHCGFLIHRWKSITEATLHSLVTYAPT